MFDDDSTAWLISILVWIDHRGLVDGDVRTDLRTAILAELADREEKAVTPFIASLDALMPGPLVTV